jgi:hypothetical protein
MSTLPQLRKEPREFGYHFVTDEIVYLSQPRDGQLEISHPLAKHYLGGDAWLDIHWTQADPCEAGNAHYNAIIGVVNNSAPANAAPHDDSETSAIKGYGSVLVDVPELVELPEGVRAKGIRSIIWLKRIEDFCDCGWKQFPLIGVGGIGSTNREVDLSCGLVVHGDRLGEKIDEIPRQLVKRGAQTIDEIPGNKRNVIFHGVQLNYEVVPRCLKVIFLADRVRAIFDPPADLRLKSIEMNLRPSGFHINVLN